jgi:hypothetical protein
MEVVLQFLDLKCKKIDFWVNYVCHWKFIDKWNFDFKWERKLNFRFRLKTFGAPQWIGINGENFIIFRLMM